MTDLSELTNPEPEKKSAPMIPIDEATAADLRAFADLVFGIDLTGSETRPQLISKLEKVGFVGDRIPQIRTLPAPTQATVEVSEIPYWVGRLKNREGKPYGVERKLCCINVMVREVPGGSQPVTPMVNGARYDIPRGKDSVVPMEYVETLLHAVERRWRSDMESGLVDYTDMPQFPFTFRPRPPDSYEDEAA